MFKFKRYERFYRRFEVPGYEETAVEKASALQARKLVLVVLLLAAAIVAAKVMYAMWRYPSDRKVEHASDVEHFKYGSIGSDNQLKGLPYDVFAVLPEAFADLLPPGAPHDYTAFGLISEPGH